MGDSFLAYTNATKTLPGDEDPADFDFTIQVSNADTLLLYERNDILQLACEWSVMEALKNRWELKTDQPVSALKFDAPYTFESFNDYLDWIEFPACLQEVLQWARLFGNALLLFYDDRAPTRPPLMYQYEDQFHSLDQSAWFLPKNPLGRYLTCTAFYPMVGNNGYSVEMVDSWGVPVLFKIQIMTDGMEKERTLYVEADRVVEFHAPRKRIKYGGSSRVIGLKHLALAAEQMLKALVRRAKKEAGGHLDVEGVNSQDEAEKLNAIVGDDLSYLDRVYHKAGQIWDYKTPDLKIQQFQDLFEILDTFFSRHLHIAKTLMGGDAQGTQSTAKYNTLFSYTEIVQIQSHFKTSVEKCFYKLGLDDTRFTWMDPSPDVQEALPGIDINHKFGEEENNGPRSDTDTSAPKSRS